MAMAEERMRVLEMIRDGKITAEEGARLLEALRPTGGAAGASDGPPTGRGPAVDDPLGTLAASVAEMLQKSGFGGWGWRGGWSSGPLNGLERRRQREAEGWEVIALSDGDHGTFELPDGARLAVETEAGGIEARAAESGPARVALEGDGLFNFAVYAARKGQDAVLSVYRTEHFARLPRLAVDVPGAIGSLAMHTSGGSLQARGFNAPLTLHTSGGGIKVREQGPGAVEAKTSGGGIDVEGRPAGIVLNTSGGAIHFRGRTEAVTAKTSGGSVTVDGARLIAGEHQLRTAGGSIRIRLSRDSAVDVSAQTSAGSLNVDLPGIQGEQSGPRMSPRYRGKYNDGGARLNLNTAAGSIHLGLEERWADEAAPSPSPSPAPSPAEGTGPQSDSAPPESHPETDEPTTI